MELFPHGHAVGMFRGASGSGLEFHADLTLPYQDDFHSLPMHGQFVLVELASPDEAVLGRVTAVAAQGRLTSASGEEYGLRALAEGREIPEDLRRQYLRYRLDVRLLGVLRLDGEVLVFAPSHRRLPHVGARVAFLPDEVLRQVAGGNTEGAELGFFALGEFVYAGDDRRLQRRPWMQVRDPRVTVRFAIGQLVARRSFVFARAGFGKSNLIKLLFANLYSGELPSFPLRDGRKVPVGTVIFDPDGEYFWPDSSGSPALCDVPELEDEVVVFTNQEPTSDFYGSFRAGGVRLDIRQLPAPLVLSIALSPEQQEQQNVHKLKALRGADWRALVDEIHRNRNAADEGTLRGLLGLQVGQDAELYAARAHMTRVVDALHDPSSEMLSLLLESLRAGKLCVVDISRMRGAAGLALSGIVLRHIFGHNQEQFTRACPEPIPTIAVIEEAQSVLGSRGSGESAYEEWVKEGRKYSLGAVLVTQQPGAIPPELLSQGDSWFVFHLLSAGDLRAVKTANAHFSDDLLSSLLNEPLPGNGVFWSSVSGAVDQAGNAYPIPLRVLSFEGTHAVRDPDGSRGAVENFAARLAAHSDERLRKTRERLLGGSGTPGEAQGRSSAGSISSGEAARRTSRAVGEDLEELDRDALYRRAAIEALRVDEEVNGWLGRRGAIPWAGVIEALKRGVPEGAIPDLGRWAYELVPAALDELYGPDGWERERRPGASDPARRVTWVVIRSRSGHAT
jgi:uncharacterized protein